MTGAYIHKWNSDDPFVGCLVTVNRFTVRHRQKHIYARTVSSQPFEIDYAVGKLQAEFPGTSLEVIRQAVIAAKKEVEPLEDCDKIMQRAATKLRYPRSPARRRSREFALIRGQTPD